MAKIIKQQFGAGTLDLPFLGLALARQPQMLQEFIVSRFASNNLALTTLFQGIYPESQGEEVLGSNQVSWEVYNLPEKPIYIDGIVGTPKVGNDIEVDLTEGWLRAGAKLRLEDGRTLLHLQTNGSPRANGIVRYRGRIVGNNTEHEAPSWLFERNRAANYQTANYEEGSHMGHPMYYGTGDKYKQAMSTHRHDADLTGDALSEVTIFETTREIPNSGGRTKTYRGWLPEFLRSPTTSLLDFHQRHCELDHIYGQSNINFETGEIFNINETNGSKKVMMGDGLIAQLDGAYTKCYDPKDSLSSIRNKVKNIITYMSAHWNNQDFLEMVVMGGIGADAVFQDVMAELQASSGVQVWRTPDSEGKVVVGLRFSEWIIGGMGKIKFVRNNSMGDITAKSRMINYNGVALNAESFDMYFMPIGMMSNGKTNIRFFSKGKTVNGQQINRSLVFSHIQGVTGYLSNNLSKASADGLSEYANLVGTSRDAEQFHLLSQKMLIVTNPTEFARLLVYR
ncbi:hypothetical protein [Spirosoma sordidisoli]|uniref:Major capsid protein n=1 Tax=Spirosoma sordidisoli TaxID=2502893 RepID=A0A4Q2US32_9BACT|nr:hypothetical protein [Spirosoma sordidisoli]RYC69639.1 hypothetical protein EQG79_13645 [Spirosoma sordidisoli]